MHGADHLYLGRHLLVEPIDWKLFIRHLRRSIEIDAVAIYLWRLLIGNSAR